MTEEGPSSRSRRPGIEGALRYDVSVSDVRPLVRGELKKLKTRLRSARNSNINTITKYHYEDAIARIDALLDPK